MHTRLTVLTAGATLPFYNEAALAQGLSAGPRLSADTIKINANENPMGPCPEAIEAIQAVVAKGGRYLYGETSTFVETLAGVEGIDRCQAKTVCAIAGNERLGDDAGTLMNALDPRAFRLPPDIGQRPHAEHRLVPCHPVKHPACPRLRRAGGQMLHRNARPALHVRQ